ncbi:MAG: multinuclear nonheme iron-dependent oxidase [Anaerolineae bacterium]
MRIAANYSRPLAALIAQSRVRVDRLKCPAWPWLVEEARQVGFPYVHFPLEVGTGDGDAIDSEKHAPPDWKALEHLLRDTGSPHINLHLGAPVGRYPGVAAEALDPDVAARVAEAAAMDVTVVVRRFGHDNVALENCLDDYGVHLLASLLPEVTAEVVRRTGCGLVLDLAHARIAAARLGWSERAYVEALPVHRLREVHVTGVQPLSEAWQERLRRNGADLAGLATYLGCDIDHLPMTDGDWQFLEWAFPWLRTHAPEPWVVAMEIGGVGPLWETLAIPEALEADLAHLRALLTA